MKRDNTEVAISSKGLLHLSMHFFLKEGLDHTHIHTLSNLED